MKALLWKSSVSTYVADLSWLINFSRTERCFYFWQLLGSERYTARLTAVTAWPRKEPPCMDLFRKSRKVCKGALQTSTSLPRSFHRGKVAGRSRSSGIPFLNRQPLTLECEKKQTLATLIFMSKISGRKKNFSGSIDSALWILTGLASPKGLQPDDAGIPLARVGEKKELIPENELFTIIWISVPANSPARAIKGNHAISCLITRPAKPPRALFQLEELTNESSMTCIGRILIPLAA